jgi:hypothetical protein
MHHGRLLRARNAGLREVVEVDTGTRLEDLGAQVVAQRAHILQQSVQVAAGGLDAVLQRLHGRRHRAEAKLGQISLTPERLERPKPAQQRLLALVMHRLCAQPPSLHETPFMVVQTCPTIGPFQLATATDRIHQLDPLRAVLLGCL